ncbi:transporter [Sedimentitalea todarodis]|uniref:Transporter n=1 Tax=Sedimentitalea todarodis TaxID=1631240 RepID=A0ABU3VDY8_9RHOB|nr:transporter [Sedimentitalea todarodis]MDU9004399.1 transporter [Sedimentitalea todarodis]
MFNQLKVSALVCGLLCAASLASAQSGGGGADLAKKLSNPVADLISVPFQYNYNNGYGADGEGQQSYVNVQPVIPISISPNWNVISRTIIPLIDQDGVIPGMGSQSGVGNITQSFFFSPKAPTKGGLVWGVGPVIQLPTASDDLAPDQWALGITGVALKQSGPWTIGALGNHLWSVSGEDEYGKLSATFLQPFLSYTTPKATSFSINTESIYNWETEEWSVPINIAVAQVVKIGKQPVQFSLGARYWAKSPQDGPDGWGARFQVTLLFPK